MLEEVALALLTSNLDVALAEHFPPLLFATGVAARNVKRAERGLASDANMIRKKTGWATSRSGTQQVESATFPFHRTERCAQ